MTAEEQVWFQALQMQVTAHAEDIRQIREQLQELKGRLDEQREMRGDHHRWDDNGGRGPRE